MIGTDFREAAWTRLCCSKTYILRWSVFFSFVSAQSKVPAPLDKWFIEKSCCFICCKTPSRDLCRNQSSHGERTSDISDLWYGQTTQRHPYLLFPDNQSLLKLLKSQCHHLAHSLRLPWPCLFPARSLSRLHEGLIQPGPFTPSCFPRSWENRSLVTNMASGHLVMLSLFSLSLPQRNLLFLSLCLIYSPPPCSRLFPPLAAKWLRNGKKMTIARSWQIFLQLLSDRDLEHLWEGPSAFLQASRDGEKWVRHNRAGYKLNQPNMLMEMSCEWSHGACFRKIKWWGPRTGRSPVAATTGLDFYRNSAFILKGRRKSLSGLHIFWFSNS